MDIREESWHARAWRQTYVSGESDIPTNVSLCSYFWRVMFSWLIIWLNNLGHRMYIDALRQVDISIERERTLTDDDRRWRQEQKAFKDEQGVEWTNRLNALVPCIALYVLLWFSYNNVLVSLLVLLGAIVAFFCLLALAVLIYAFVAKLIFRQLWLKEGVQLVKEFLKARKNRVCPLIKFV